MVQEEKDMRDLIIIGSGPAGLTAAIYAARADLKPLVIEGIQPGGQLTITTEVENFPGFPEGIQGPELMERMRQQAQKFGSEHVFDLVTRVDFSRRPFEVYIGETKHEAKTVIVATGASARWLGLEGEKRLQGRGVSACATCDGFFFRDMKVAVVGGGDSAVEEATFLSRFAREVVIVHRRNELRASAVMRERAARDPKISFLWDSLPEEILGDDVVTGMKVRNVKTGEVSVVPLDGVFMAIGHTPNTEVLKGHLDLDEKGYLKVDHMTRTSVPGVFGCGDVVDTRYRQAITAAGWGAMAALDAQHWLAEHAG